MLLFFLSDYAQGRNEIRSRFEDDPDAVYVEYGITRGDLDCLRSMTDNVRALLPEGVNNLVRALLLPPEVELKWPGPQLRIVDVTPGLVPRDVEVVVALEIDVDPDDVYDGDGFGVEVVFIRAGGERVEAVVEPLQLAAGPVERVVVRCTAKFAKPGAYAGLVTVTRQTVPVKRELSRFGLGRLVVT